MTSGRVVAGTSRRSRTAEAATSAAPGPIHSVYAKLPELDCLGLCWESCGPIGMSHVERRTIAAKHGVEIPFSVNCPALTFLHRCSIYEDRPLICRLWGVVEAMPCPHGCRPDRYLSDAEGQALLREMDALDRRPS